MLENKFQHVIENSICVFTVHLGQAKTNKYIESETKKNEVGVGLSNENEKIRFLYNLYSFIVIHFRKHFQRFSVKLEPFGCGTLCHEVRKVLAYL